jgi:peptide/nickel transport system ATP-binding protein
MTTMTHSEPGVRHLEAPLLSVRDLRVSFRTEDGVVRAVDGLSFDLAKGATLGIVGESGSGKSVTGLALLGLHNPRHTTVEGRIRFEDTDLVGGHPGRGTTRSPDGDVTREVVPLGKRHSGPPGRHHRGDRRNRRLMARLRGSRIAMVFQDPLTSLSPYHTVGRQIGEVYRTHRGAGRREARDRAIEMLERVGIPNARARVDDYPHHFSGGMRQRVMIAMALVCEPDLLIADEPTTALDVTVQAQILDLLADLQSQSGTAIILITHDLGVVARTAHDVLVMYAGRAVERGPTRDVLGTPRHPYTWGLLSSVPTLRSPVDAPLTPVRGTPPSLLDPPSGCPFHPRCDHLAGAGPERCRRERPELLPNSGHGDACHLSSAQKQHILRHIKESR